MKQTNFQLFDFLDFSTDLDGEDILWKACQPVDFKTDASDVVVNIPFQEQNCSNDIAPNTGSSRKNHHLRLRAYGNKIIRASIGFGCNTMPDSPMLEVDDRLQVQSLQIRKADGAWVIYDQNDITRAVFNLTLPPVDYWSHLIPGPEESVMASFFPDGKTEIKISAYDQFFPARQDAFALAYIERNRQPNRATISFHADPDESFAGTGERFARMDLSGQTFQLENQDAQGVNNRRTYKNIPFFVSSRIYGMFLHTSAFTKFSFADHSTRSVQILTEQPLIDLFLIGGDNLEEILYNYRQLTGFPSQPPLWSFGTWMSRMTYYSAVEVKEVCNRLRKEDFPCDVIHLDTGWFRTNWLCEWKFSPERFPDPKKFVADLKKEGFRVSIWQLPYIASKAEQLKEAVDKKYTGTSKGSYEKGGSDFSLQDYAGTIDLTNPEAVKWYQDILKELLEFGISCIKTDFGEEIHMNAEYMGMEPGLLRNLYGLLYQKAVYEITKEITGEGIIWARAGWAGCQRYPVHWGGDAACSWDGMAGSLKGGLHLGLSGFGYWSHDVPGFHGIPDFMNTVIPDDLYVRWTQFGVFSSHIRYHGSSKREPYHFPNISDIIRKWLKLRYALIPYLAEQSRKVSRTGFPVLRAMIFHHPEDKICWHIDNQYFFGDDFLVAPVMNPNNKRDIYLPEGQWVNFFDGKIVNGKQWIKDMEIPLAEMPVWVKYGEEIPFYPYHANCTDEMDLSRAIPIRFDETYKGIYGTAIGEITGFRKTR